MSTVTKLKTNIYRDFVESKSSFLHDVTREVLTELIWKTYNFSSRVLLRKLPTKRTVTFPISAKTLTPALISNNKV